MRNTKLQVSKGFTLIELMVVITIIGLLASTVLASLQDARKAGRDGRMISDMKQVQNAVEMFRNANNGQYPCTPAVPVGFTNPRVVTMTSGCADITPYLSEPPTSPNETHTNTNNDYLYRARSVTDRNSYTLLVKLYRNNNGNTWCSITHGGLGYSTWNGLSEATGLPDGTNYPPCF